MRIAGMHKLLSGVLITLLLVGCGSGSSSHPRLPQSPAANDVRHYPVEPDGPYAEVLAQCAFEYIRDGHNDINRTCPMSTLPLLGQEEARSEEHTSELQSRGHLVCRLLLEKKNKTKR